MKNALDEVKKWVLLDNSAQQDERHSPYQFLRFVINDLILNRSISYLKNLKYVATEKNDITKFYL